MTMNRRQCSTAIGVTGGLIGFTPLSVKAMVPMEEQIIPVYEKVAQATVLRSFASVPEHPLTGGTPLTYSVRMFQRMNLRWWGSR